MSDELDPEADDDSSTIRQMREQLKEAKKAEARAAELERQLAFSKAGIDPDDPRQKYFASGYQGEMTAEAIRKEALAAGFLDEQPAQPTPDPQLEAERAAHAEQAQSGTGTGAGVTDPHNVDPLADLRTAPRGLPPEDFALQIAQRLQQQGGEVSFEGPMGRPVPNDGTPSVR